MNIRFVLNVFLLLTLFSCDRGTINQKVIELNDLAMDEYEKGNYKESLNYLSEALRRDDTYSTAYNNKIVVYKTISDFDSALITAKEYVTAKPNSSGAWLIQGLLYDYFEETDMAYYSYSKALKILESEIDSNYSKNTIQEMLSYLIYLRLNNEEAKVSEIYKHLVDRDDITFVQLKMVEQSIRTPIEEIKESL